MKPASPRRRSGGFTIIELLMAASITVILAGIASDLFLRIQSLVSMGAANSEVTNDAAGMERMLRNDFRALTPKGFLAVRWTDQPVIGMTTPQIGAGGSITGLTVNYPGSNLSTLTSNSIAFFDPANPANNSAQGYVVLNPNGRGVTGVTITSAGSGYGAQTVAIVCQPADQMAFFANGPWVTANYLVYDATVQAQYSQTNLYQTTNGAPSAFTTDSARIYYGHLSVSANSPFTIDNGWYAAGGIISNQATIAPWQWRLGRQAMLLTNDTIQYPGGTSPPFQATQSIWQTTNTPSSPGAPTYGVETGQSDIVQGCNLDTIRQSILTSTPPLPGAAYIDASTPTGWASTPAQRMAQSCLRLYGTPYLDPTTSVTLGNTLFNSSVLVPACSTFKIDVQVASGTALAHVARPCGAIVLATTDASGVSGLTGKVATINTLAAGLGYSPNVMATLPNPPASGFSITPAVLSASASGGGVTVTIVSGGSGYPPHATIPVIISDCYSAGYSLETVTGSGCQAWPRIIEITTTLQDQIGTIHNYAVTDPSLPDGRLYRFILEVPQQ